MLYQMQESLCAEAASFDLPSGLLTACISEVKKCFDISISRREKSNDKSCKSDNFSLLKGEMCGLNVVEGFLMNNVGFTKFE